MRSNSMNNSFCLALDGAPSMVTMSKAVSQRSLPLWTSTRLVDGLCLPFQRMTKRLLLWIKLVMVSWTELKPEATLQSAAFHCGSLSGLMASNSRYESYNRPFFLLSRSTVRPRFPWNFIYVIASTSTSTTYRQALRIIVGHIILFCCMFSGVV